ncbi:Asp-tRNA(Asn)/Glu-tRNA(Gln) amidotransferase subunit GatA [Candidatus Bathyarchaeota archaeon]|nr:Asp-tRNA(Asn)/Glu-tRNA(Gln) amidotransferase subunit GatA [Candidatus Bathyarchaeota archaeon]
MTKPPILTAREIVKNIKSGVLSAEDYLDTSLAYIREVDSRVHAFLTVTEEEARVKAKQIDSKAKRGESLGRLAGVTVALKDNLCMKGIPSTCSSRMLRDFRPPYDATVVERLKMEDAIIIGKTNMDEFAMGTSTESSYFGPTRNPWNTEYVPGGSSGGSAAAVAAREVPLALGSDTGGSVRCPASFCSVVGLKPTYGLVSRYGLIAYANSLDQIGPLARDVYDCALLLDVISGHDPQDSTSSSASVSNHLKSLDEPIDGIRVGVPKEFFGEGVDDIVSREVMRGIKRLEEAGATTLEVSLPSLRYALAAYYIVAMSEASSNLARYDGLRYGHNVLQPGDDWNTFFSRSRREGFGPEVRRRIILGTYALSAGYYNRYYLKALQVRTLISGDFEKAFKSCDVLAGPTMPVLPFRLGEKLSDPLELYMCDILTVPANLVGCPAISVPCSVTSGLPVGLQLFAPFFREDLLLRTGRIVAEDSHGGLAG